MNPILGKKKEMELQSWMPAEEGAKPGIVLLDFL
jgi:hypothetical protein